MTRQLRMRSASISVDELLANSPWFGQIGVAAQRQLRTDVVERAIASGDSLGHHGETQHYWYGVMEGPAQMVDQCARRPHRDAGGPVGR